MFKTKLKNIHPGEILLEEFLVPMSISQNKLAQAKGFGLDCKQIMIWKKSANKSTKN